MKRMIRVLVAAAVLVTSLTCSAFAATKDYTTDIDGTVNYDVTTGKYTATYTGSDLIAGNQYVLLVSTVGANGERQITQESIQYIDQADEVNFTFIPKTVTDAEVLLGGEFADGGASPKVLGTILSQGILGDVTLDGSVNIKDSVRLLRHVAGVEPLTDSVALKMADVNEDSAVNIKDSVRLLRHVAGVEPFPWLS